MIDYGTLKVYEEHDLLELYDQIIPQPLPPYKQSFVIVMKHFRGCINPSTVDSALKVYYNDRNEPIEELKRTQ